MQNFQYFSPRNLGEVVSLFEKLHRNTYIMAGGTDLLVHMKNREMNPHFVIDIKRIPHLKYIDYDDNFGLKMGAVSSIADIEKNPHVSSQYDLLVKAASSIGSVQIRNKGTIGGNLCNGSPAADMAPPLIVIGATVRLFSKDGERIVNLEDFFVGPGKTILQFGEILTEIQVPKLPSGFGATYLKYSRRGGLDLPIVGIACLLVLTSGCRCELARIAMGAVGPKPFRAKRAEVLMTGERINDSMIEKVARLASEEAEPISDIRASANYRREIIKVLVNRAIRICIQKKKSGVG